MDIQPRPDQHDETDVQRLQREKYNASIGGAQTGEIRRAMDALRAKVNRILEDLDGAGFDSYELAFKHDIAKGFFAPAAGRLGYHQPKIQGMWELKPEIQQERKIKVLETRNYELEKEKAELEKQVRDLKLWLAESESRLKQEEQRVNKFK